MLRNGGTAPRINLGRVALRTPNKRLAVSQRAYGPSGRFEIYPLTLVFKMMMIELDVTEGTLKGWTKGTGHLTHDFMRTGVYWTSKWYLGDNFAYREHLPMSSRALITSEF